MALTLGLGLVELSLDQSLVGRVIRLRVMWRELVVQARQLSAYKRLTLLHAELTMS